VVALPTETVYGVAALPSVPGATAKLFELKGRSADVPLAVLCTDADQALGLPDRTQPPFVDDADAALAVLAVIEGDATLLMNLWALSELPITDQFSMALDPGIAAAQAALDAMPYYLQRELLYPYTEGLDWACQHYLDGGWAAIDAAYDDPPATTAEVLWGEAPRLEL
jgi:hypothetical protein